MYFVQEVSIVKLVMLQPADIAKHLFFVMKMKELISEVICDKPQPDYSSNSRPNRPDG